MGDTVGYGASPNECCAIVRKPAPSTPSSATTTPRSPGRMDYSYYYDAARQALDLHARLLTPENMAVAEGRCPTRCAKGDVHFCHGSPLNLEEFEYIFAPEQAARVPAIWDDLGAPHAHRPLPPLQGVRADARTASTRWSPTKFELRPGWKYIVSVGSVGQPRDYDNRAQLHALRHREDAFEFKRVEYDIEAAAEKIFGADLERNFGHRLFIGV